MVDPVPGGIQGKREVIYGIFVDFVIELEENSEANACKDDMCIFEENMII